MKTIDKMKIKIGPWKKKPTTNRSRPQKKTSAAEAEVTKTRGHGSAEKNALAVTVLEHASAASEEMVKKEEETAVLVHSRNDTSDSAMMTTQAAEEVAKDEAKATSTEKKEATLGDMEIAPKPPTHNTPRKTLPLKDVPPKLPNGSPTSQLELDILNATHPNLDLINLQKSYSTSLMDDDKSISSEEDLLKDKETEKGEDDNDLAGCSASGCIDVTREVGVGCKDGVADLVDEVLGSPPKEANGDAKNHNTTEELPEFVNQVLSPMANFTDYMFCRMESNLPDVVEEVNEFLSNDLHHLIFNCEGEEAAAQDAQEEEGAGELEAVEEEELDVTQEDEEVEEEVEEKQEVGVETAWGPSPEDGQEQGVRGVAVQNEQGGGDEEDAEEEGGNEVLVVDGQNDSMDVEAVLGRGEWEEVMQTRLECASYSPATGFLLRKDRRPEPSEDEVLVRVDATTISTRDCFEKRRRDNTLELIEELWVPGHEIVGHVVRTGTGADAEFLLGKRIAALLPYGGGCSQYACIYAKDAIVLPDEADSNEVAALLSMYMAAFQCLESVVGVDSKVGEFEPEVDDFETLSVADSVVDEEEEADAESIKDEDVERESKAEEDNASIKEDAEDNSDVGPKEEEDTESKGDEDIKTEDSTIESKGEENTGDGEDEPKDEADVELQSKIEEGSVLKVEEDVESEKVNIESEKDDVHSERKDVESEREHVESERKDVEAKKEDDIGVKPKEEGLFTGCSCTPIILSSAEEDEVKQVDVNEKNDSKGEGIIAVESSLIADDDGQEKSPLFGMKVLIVGAGSPVGLALVDLARNAGAIVHALSERSHLIAIRELGAKRWYELSHRTKWESDWRAELDLVIDTIGDSDFIPFFYTVMKTRGRLIRVNTTSCGKKYEPLRPRQVGGLKNLLRNRLNRHDYKQRVINDKTVDDYNIFNSYGEDKELFEEDLAYLQDLRQVGKIAPKIFSRVGFDQLEGEWKKVVTADGISGVVVVSPWKVGFTKVG